MSDGMDDVGVSEVKESPRPRNLTSEQRMLLRVNAAVTVAHDRKLADLNNTVWQARQRCDNQIDNLKQELFEVLKQVESAQFRLDNRITVLEMALIEEVKRNRKFDNDDFHDDRETDND